ncbi:uncharacterized protein LOC143018609 [Oratosquilla oratoria]|uniref:uncharacterized protein LOC143018609 n=1 Tax=Oratosquilla oratoria TaxID=337810 RepID=UPI003F76497A
MKEEVNAAVIFIAKLIGRNVMDEKKVQFEEKLRKRLTDRFRNHWHPEKPWRGQGYRCLRVNENIRKEPTIEMAAIESGLTYEDLNLPVEITIWVDPLEVCCRFGEQKGSCCTVASFRDGNKENFIDTFDFSGLERIGSKNSNSSKGKVLKENLVQSQNILTSHADKNNNCNKNLRVCKTPPSSSLTSSPTKNKSSFGSGSKSHHSSPSRSSNHLREKRSPNQHYNLHHQNGSYSPPFLKTQPQWMSQTPPPPGSVPLFSTPGFIYPSTPSATSHYTPPTSHHHFSRSPPAMGPHKLKWSNSGSYPRNDRHQWFSQRALARV